MTLLRLMEDSLNGGPVKGARGADPAQHRASRGGGTAGRPRVLRGPTLRSAAASGFDASPNCRLFSSPDSPPSFVGAWRSPVAHLLWEQGVGGSNPLAPTSFHPAASGAAPSRPAG